MLVNIHCLSGRNVGDAYSSPLRYFEFPNTVKVDVCQPADVVNIPLSSDIIVGGGGLFANFNVLDRLLPFVRGKMFSWGAGHNCHQAVKVEWPRYMRQFTLHGIRDYRSPWPWVPCASCMHKAFDQSYEITHDAVVYSHKHHAIQIGGLPYADNEIDTIEEAVSFLGSAELIITNTYHGAYWATLLNRKVMIVDPFSTRFFYYKHQPLITCTQRWRDDIDEAVSFPLALQECRKANVEHYERVKLLLGTIP